MQEWVCKVLAVSFCQRFRECPPMMGASSAFVDKGSIMNHTALRSLTQLMQPNNVIEVVRYTASLPCPKETWKMETGHRPPISQLLPRDSPLHDVECGTHSAISTFRRLGLFHLSPGCLFPHTHRQGLPKMSSISDSGHHITVHSIAVFSSTLGPHQYYDRDTHAGTGDGHQSLSLPE